MYVDSNPKTGNWVKVETASEATEPATELNYGKVININSQKGFAFFKPDAIGENVFIPPHLVTNHSLTEGMTVQVEIEEYTDNRTSELKNRVKRIEI
jgi:cold shock CspA family protein